MTMRDVVGGYLLVGFSAACSAVPEKDDVARTTVGELDDGNQVKAMFASGMTSKVK